MKRVIFLSAFLAVFSLPLIVQSQVFWTEDFQNSCSSGCTTYSGINGAWAFTDVTAPGPNPNKWFVSGAECGNAAGACGSSCGNTDPSLHIGPDPNSYCTCVVCADPTGDCGATYDDCDPAFNLCGGGDPSCNKRAESPIVNCSGKSNIKICFNYIEGGQNVQDNAVLEYFDGSSWSQIDDPSKTSLCGVQGLWTAYTFSLPASADNNPNVKIGFRWQCTADGGGVDPSFAVDDIQLVTIPTTSSISGLTSVSCGQAGVTYSVTNNTGSTYAWTISGGGGIITGGNGTNTITVTWGGTPGVYNVTVTETNCSGSAAPISLPVTVSCAGGAPVADFSANLTNICENDCINFTDLSTNTPTSWLWTFAGGVPGTSTTQNPPSICYATAGTYQVDLTATNGFGSDTETKTGYITVTAAGAASVSIAVAPDDTVCAGDNVTFTATPTNGGTPTYDWRVNGVSVGAPSSPTYNTTTLSNGDIVTCVMTSSLACATGSPATSNPITMTILGSVAAGISISVAPDDTVCAGEVATFTATATNGGATPAYQWQINGTNVGGNSDTYTNSSLANGDIVTCIMTSSLSCATGSPVTSSPITMTVFPLPGATAFGDTTIAYADSAQLTGIGTGTLSWSPSMGLSCTNCANPKASPTTDTWYYFTVTDATNGCSSKDSVLVKVLPNECKDIFIPNAFTPNGDGRNDYFFGQMSCKGTVTLSVYNRWGLLVFQGDLNSPGVDPTKGWDGKSKGVEQPVGVYLYSITVSALGQQPFVKSGSFVLIR